MEHPICDLLKLSNETLKNLIGVDEIIGKPLVLENNVTVIPISKIKCTFVAGGTEFEKEKHNDKLPFGGATGGNVNITPIAFLIIRNNEIKVLHLENNTHLIEKAMEELPSIVEKIKDSLFHNNKSKEYEVEKSIII